MSDYGPETTSDSINKTSPLMTPWTIDLTGYRTKYTLTSSGGKAIFQVYSSTLGMKTQKEITNDTLTFYVYYGGKHRVMAATDSVTDVDVTITIEADQLLYPWGNKMGIRLWKSSTTEWIDYTEKVIKAEFDMVKNGNYILLMTMASVDESDALLTEGNYVALYAGNKFLHKFVMREPNFLNYDRDSGLGRVTKVRAITSTGNQPGSIKYNMMDENTEDDEYTDEKADDMLKNFLTKVKKADASYEKICEIVTDLGDSEALADEKISMSLKYEGRLRAVKKLCEILDGEFWWDYANIADDNQGDDTLYVKRKKGSDKELTLKTQDDANAVSIESENVQESIVNDIVLVGKIKGLEQLTTRNFHATLKRTFLDGKLDTYLAEDLDTSETGVDVKDGSNFSNNDYIKVDNEIMLITAGGGTNTFNVTRAQGGTSASAHKTGADVLQWGDGSDLTNGGDFTLTVDATASFDASGNLYAGSEVMTYSAKPTGTTFTITDRAQNDSAGDSTTAYTHGDGIEVYDSQYYHTHADSQTGSSIDLYGHHAKKITDENALNRNDLDLHAQNYRKVYDWIDVAGSEDPILQLKALATNFVEFFDAEGITLGDSIKLLDSSTGLDGTSYYQIVGAKYKFAPPLEELMLELSNQPLDYTKIFKEGIDRDYTGPTRDLIERIGEYSSWDGSNYSINTPSGDIIIDGERTYIYGNSWLGLDVDAGTLDISNDSGDIQVYAVGGKVSLGSDNLMEFGEFKLTGGDSMYLYSNSDYLEIYHSGTDGIIKSVTNPLTIYSKGATKFRHIDYVGADHILSIEKDAYGWHIIQEEDAEILSLGIADQAHLVCNYNGDVTLESYSTGDVNIVSGGGIKFFASGDSTDYIYFETTSNVPAIKTAGTCSLDIEPSGTYVNLKSGKNLRIYDSGNSNYLILSQGTDGNLACEGDLILNSGGGNVRPPSWGDKNLGTSTYYWNEIHYKTLTDEGCLGGCSYLESATDAICNLEILPEVKTDDFGDSRLDYSTFPKELQMGSGVNVSGVISMLLKSIKELNDRIEKLENT